MRHGTGDLDGQESSEAEEEPKYARDAASPDEAGELLRRAPHGGDLKTFADNDGERKHDESGEEVGVPGEVHG